MPWEHFAHAADMGVRGIGETKNEAFEEAAKALMALATDLEQVSPKEKVEVSLSAPDDEQLLVEWLDALVY
ncbi:MAG TPA: archease, partial [Vicinamibacteria bacterium]